MEDKELLEIIAKKKEIILKKKALLESSAMTEKNRVGIPEGMLREAAEGAFWATTPYIEAGARSLVGPESFSEELDTVRAKMKGFEAEHPYKAGGADIVGSLVSGGAAAKAGLGILKSAAGRFAMGAGEGALRSNTEGGDAAQNVAVAGLGGAINAASPLIKPAGALIGAGVGYLSGDDTEESLQNAGAGAIVGGFAQGTGSAAINKWGIPGIKKVAQGLFGIEKIEKFANRMMAKSAGITPQSVAASDTTLGVLASEKTATDMGKVLIEEGVVQKAGTSKQEVIVALTGDQNSAIKAEKFSAQVQDLGPGVDQEIVTSLDISDIIEHEAGQVSGGKLGEYRDLFDKTLNASEKAFEQANDRKGSVPLGQLAEKIGLEINKLPDAAPDKNKILAHVMSQLEVYTDKIPGAPETRLVNKKLVVKDMVGNKLVKEQVPTVKMKVEKFKTPSIKETSVINEAMVPYGTGVETKTRTIGGGEFKVETPTIGKMKDGTQSIYEPYMVKKMTIDQWEDEVYTPFWQDVIQSNRDGGNVSLARLNVYKRALGKRMKSSLFSSSDNAPFTKRGDLLLYRAYKDTIVDSLNMQSKDIAKQDPSLAKFGDIGTYLDSVNNKMRNLIMTSNVVQKGYFSNPLKFNATTTEQKVAQSVTGGLVGSYFGTAGAVAGGLVGLVSGGRIAEAITQYGAQSVALALSNLRVPRSTAAVLENKNIIIGKLMSSGSVVLAKTFESIVNQGPDKVALILPGIIKHIPDAFTDSKYPSEFNGKISDPLDREIYSTEINRNLDMSNSKKAAIISNLNKDGTMYREPSAVPVNKPNPELEQQMIKHFIK